MSSGLGEQLEILVLGPVVLRQGRAETAIQDGKPAEALLALVSARGEGWVYTRQAVRTWRPPSGRDQLTESAVHQRMRKLREYGVPVETGPRNSGRYRLTPGSCRVDAWDFVAGVQAGADIDELTRMWRQPPSPRILDLLLGSAVGDARRKLIERIAGLDDVAQDHLADLDRFTAIFPDDRSVDRIRRHGPRRRKRLLVVEDDPDMLEEICGRLEPTYRCVRIQSIEEWQALRDRGLDGIDGALVDLHLTPDRDDKRGQDIVSYLCKETEIPAALVTANAPDRSAYGSAAHRKEFRLVDIVDKQQRDWWEPLQRAVRFLVSDAEDDRRHRLETWLEHAFRTVERANASVAPGSVGALQMQDCRVAYGDVIRAIRVEPIEDAASKVDEFCRRWRVRN
ncbi:hypothetical protein ACIBTV_29400 [Micromonospora sp. NPDC049366]|uniref:hypothetical protein n=1 Tax=Micromonospora sp. NPDC049366 TaxID=3364271 RepID=UPI003791D96E